MIHCKILTGEWLNYNTILKERNKFIWKYNSLLTPIKNKYVLITNRGTTSYMKIQYTIILVQSEINLHGNTILVQNSSVLY